MTLHTLTFLLLAFATGLGIGLLIAYFQVKQARSLTEKLLADKTAETNALLQQMKDSFSALSLEALGKSSEQFLTLAKEQLGQKTQENTQAMEGKKTLIDQTLKSMKGELNKVNELVQNIEKDRKAKFDVLSDQLTKAASETKRLTETTGTLQAALTNSRVRGQWGDRMAEDVLRLAGFVEGINYQKQQTIKDGESIGRPDYTFYLPQKRIVNMDVKFPLENYLLWLDAATESEKEKYRKQFLQDARARVKEAATRGYADGNTTLDYVLMFIPNEQVYTFLHEQDRTLLDDALQQKVILCSPMTLYAILAVIRQAVDNFHLERTAGEIMDLLNVFYSQWDKFCEAMEKVGQKIESSQQEFVKLTTTRKNMLEKPLRKIDALRENEHLTSTGNKLELIDNGSEKEA